MRPESLTMDVGPSTKTTSLDQANGTPEVKWQKLQHETFMRRAIELSRKGGIVEKAGGTIRLRSMFNLRPKGYGFQLQFAQVALAQ